MSVRFTVFYPPHCVERAILARPAVRQGDFPCVAWHCGACRKLVLDTANCTRAEHLTSEGINRRIIYGADAEHLSESREEE